MAVNLYAFELFGNWVWFIEQNSRDCIIIMWFLVELTSTEAECLAVIFAVQQNWCEIRRNLKLSWISYTLITMNFHLNIVPYFHSYNMHDTPGVTHAHKYHSEMNMIYGHMWSIYRISVHLYICYRLPRLTCRKHIICWLFVWNCSVNIFLLCDFYNKGSIFSIQWITHNHL